MQKKQDDENDLRTKVDANPEWKAAYGDAWDTIAGVEEKVKPEIKHQLYRRSGSQLFSLAVSLVQYVAEVKKPDGERLPQFHEAGLESLKYQLLSPAPIYTDVEKMFMKTSMNLAVKNLGANDEFVQAVLHGGDVNKTVDAMVDGTKLADPKVRQALIDGGEAAVAASTDPDDSCGAALRSDLPRQSTKHIHDSEDSVLVPAEQKLGKARFAVYGQNAYPDATFSLGLRFGAVDGCPASGTVAPPFTTLPMVSTTARPASATREPFNLTGKESAALSKIDLSTPLDFVSTADIIGGNSGSPVIDRNGDIVGLIFRRLY